MNLTKNQIYIISAVVIAVIVYFVFFRKKTRTITATATSTPAESGYYGETWGWGTGAQEITPEMAMRSMSGPAGNSVVSTMESNFNVQTGLSQGHRPANAWQVTPESNYSQAMLRAGSGTDWLQQG